jgi:hypothetical protein
MELLKNQEAEYYKFVTFEQQTLYLKRFDVHILVLCHNIVTRHNNGYIKLVYMPNDIKTR